LSRGPVARSVSLFTLVNKYNNLISSQYSENANNRVRKLRQTKTDMQSSSNTIMTRKFDECEGIAA